MMRIESLSQMIPFFDFAVVEKISVEAVKHNFIAMKIDHMRGVVVFCNLVSLVHILLDDLITYNILLIYNLILLLCNCFRALNLMV